MIDKKISVSEQVANLSIPAQLVYTWAVAHADDVGLLPSSMRTLKGTIVPLWDMQIDAFEKLVQEIVEEGLWETYEYQKVRYYRLTSFTKYQTLKRDRQPQTILPIPMHEGPRDSWVELEALGFQVEASGFQKFPEVKRREEKRSEGKRSEDMVNAFDTFWQEYPRKTAKSKAKQAFDKLNPSQELFSTIMKALEVHKRQKGWIKDDGQFIPHPATWLNQGRWEDEVSSGAPKKTGSKYNGL